MTLPDKIKLVDDLIQENRDTTIWDYISLLNDIESIEKEADMKHMRITQEQHDIIMQLAGKADYKEIKAAAGVALCTVHHRLKMAGYDLLELRRQTKAYREEQEILRRAEEIKKRRAESGEALDAPVIPGSTDLEQRKRKAEDFMNAESQAKSSRFERPAAVYSNHSPFGIAS